jgi:hypothetical protein
LRLKKTLAKRGVSSKKKKKKKDDKEEKDRPADYERTCADICIYISRCVLLLQYCSYTE